MDMVHDHEHLAQVPPEAPHSCGNNIHILPTLPYMEYFSDAVIVTALFVTHGRCITNNHRGSS